MLIRQLNEITQYLRIDFIYSELKSLTWITNHSSDDYVYKNH